MEFSKISSLFTAVKEGKIKETDCISFNAQNNTLTAEGRTVRIIHDVGCFLAKGILKVITIKKLADYVARHLDSAAVFKHNTKVAEFQNLKGKVTGKLLKELLDNDNNKKLLIESENTISVPPEMEKFLSKNATSKITSEVTPTDLSTENLQSENDITTNTENISISNDSTSNYSEQLIFMLRDTKKTANDIKEFLDKHSGISKEVLFQQTNDMPYCHIEAVLARTNQGSDNKTIKETKNIITLLINNNAPLNGLDKKGMSLISRVIYKKYNEKSILDLIDSVKSNDILNKQINESSTPLITSIDNGKDDITNKLIKTTDLNQHSTYKTALTAAVEKKNIAIVKKLLESKADVNLSATFGGMTPLLWACFLQIEALVPLLLKYNADINLQNKDKFTALIYACYRNDNKIAQSLLKYNADTNLKNLVGDTALIWACKNKNKDLVKLLLNHGADINLQNKRKETALFIACKEQDKEIVQLLLKYDADPNIENNQQISPLSYAKENKLTEIEQLLMDKINKEKNKSKNIM